MDTTDPNELDNVALACRGDRHDFPRPGDPDFKYEYRHVGGYIREAEIDHECRGGCGTVKRAVYEVFPGPRFIPKGVTRYTHPKDRNYLLKYDEGAPRFTRADARGLLAQRLNPKAKWPKARPL